MKDTPQTISQHFVTFYSPGTFMAETTTKKIKEWNEATAVKMSRRIKERHGARPYAFRFSTRSRGPDDLDSKIVEESSVFYLGGKVETLEEITARNDPEEETLRSNMEIMKWDRVVSTTEGWSWTQPLEEGDVVLDMSQFK